MTVDRWYLAIIIACLVAAALIVAFAERIDAAQPVLVEVMFNNYGSL